MNKKEQDFLYAIIGNQIKEQRKKAKPKLSQDGLATVLGLSRTSVVNIEKGRQHPSIHLLIDLARVLHVPLSVFIHDELLPETDSAILLRKVKRQLGKTASDKDSEKVLGFIMGKKLKHNNNGKNK